MKCRHDGDAKILVFPCPPATSKSGDAFVGLEDELGRGGAKCDDHLGLDDVELRSEIGCRCIDLIDGGSAIVRWSCLEEVGDLHVITFKSHCSNDLLEFRASGTDERSTGLILLGARGFAYEHESGSGRPFSKHRSGGT